MANSIPATRICTCPICMIVQARRAIDESLRVIDESHETWINGAEENSMALYYLLDEVAAVLLDPKLGVESRRRLADALNVCSPRLG